MGCVLGTPPQGGVGVLPTLKTLTLLLGRGGSLAKAVVMEDLLRSGLVQSGLFPITWVSGKRRLRATMKPVRQRIIYAYGAHACMNRG
jgi:hypothetical protein